MMRDKRQQLEQEIQELKGQLGRAQQAPVPSRAPESTVTVRSAEEAQETPAAPKEENKKNSVDIYGHIMLDSGYEFGQTDPNWFDVMRPTKLASFKGQYAPDGSEGSGGRSDDRIASQSADAIHVRVRPVRAESG